MMRALTLSAIVQVSVPDGLKDEIACQFYGTPVAAAGLLAVLAVPKGEWILQNAGATFRNWRADSDAAS